MQVLSLKIPKKVEDLLRQLSRLSSELAFLAFLQPQAHRPTGLEKLTGLVLAVCLGASWT
jgi:hypothetical protein